MSWFGTPRSVTDEELEAEERRYQLGLMEFKASLKKPARFNAQDDSGSSAPTSEEDEPNQGKGKAKASSGPTSRVENINNCQYYFGDSVKIIV